MYHKTLTGNAPILLTLDHHSIEPNDEIWMMTHLGPMKPVISSNVYVFMEVINNNHTFTEDWPENCEYRSDVFWEVSNNNQIPDFHNTIIFRDLSKNMFKTARYILIYEELNLLSEASLYRQELSIALSQLAEQKDTPYKIVNNAKWGGFVFNGSRLSVLFDRGTGYHNNHPQYFGYVIYAASVVAKKDSLWTSQQEWIESYTQFFDILTNIVFDFNHESVLSAGGPYILQFL